jgi:hypothetical protein
MQAIQLDLFVEAESSQIEKDIHYVKEIAVLTKNSSDKVRKSLFARHNELAKMYVDLHNRLDIIERNICGR